MKNVGKTSSPNTQHHSLEGCYWVKNMAQSWTHRWSQWMLALIKKVPVLGLSSQHGQHLVNMGGGMNELIDLRIQD